MKKTVAFCTLGCKVNQYETDAMRELFKNAGYETVSFEAAADVYVVNTCTVTSVGDKKSRQMLRRAKKTNKNALVAAVGCMVQTAPEQTKKIEDVDIIIGTNEKSKILESVERALAEKKKLTLVKNISKETEFEDISGAVPESRERAYIKIQEGCDCFCSYCIIPYARGRSRSRNEAAIISEALRLAEKGFLEAVLTGIHVSSYGKDTGKSLLGLLEKINGIEKIKRIRLSSIDPMAFDEEFVRGISRLDKVCPHFHISLQSGSDAVLKKMNRRYTAQQFLQVLERLRGCMADVSVTTDIIVGFPGETEQEFQNTCELLKKAAFSGVHVFPYSEREGTPAASFDAQVSKQVRGERAAAIAKIAEETKKEFLRRYIGKTLEILPEQSRNSYTEGFSPNYLRVYAEGAKKPADKIVPVKINALYKDGLKGIIV